MRVLVTAGCVYGRLDDNKLVGNRVRGLWAGLFATYLEGRGHEVTLLVADTMPKDEEIVGRGPKVKIIRHNGYDSYRAQCLELAPTVDAAVMAAAVVNWIPAAPIKGKMPTTGYREGDIIQIPFVLAPRVIQGMKARNPKLTLIGCKMLIGAPYEDLIEAAYSGVLLPARCNVVVANDPQAGLKNKWLVYQDRTVQHFGDSFEAFYEALEAVILDQHYETAHTLATNLALSFPAEAELFDRIVDSNRSRFVRPVAGRDMVFGAVAVKTAEGWLCSPREKGQQFSAKNAVLVTKVIIEHPEGRRFVDVEGLTKATLNAPLLIRFGEASQAAAVLHLHEQLPDVPTLPYAPPGTVRDNERTIPIKALTKGFNIEGHGFLLPIYAQE